MFKRLINNEGFKRYFANTSWLFLEQILRMIAGLLVGVWVARYLGPEKLGIFSYAIAFTAIFGGISKLGLDGIVIRELVKEPNKRDLYLGTAFWLKLAGAFLTLGMVVVTTIITSDDQLTNLYIYIIATGMIFQSFEVVDFYFQANVLAKFISICKVVQLFLSSLLKVYFVATGKSLIWFVVVSLIDQMTLAISYYLAYKLQKLGSFYDTFNFDVAKSLMRDSWPLILSSLAVIIYARIDQVMIKEVLGIKNVGLYSIGVQLSEVWYFVPVLITSSLFPAIVRAKQVSEKLYYERLQKLYSIMIWSAIVIAIIGTIMSGIIIDLMYGKAYLEAASVLKIYIWSNVFVFIGSVNWNWYIVENMQKIATINTIISAFANITLNFFLIKKMGIAGAAIATIISYFVSACLLNVFYKQTRKNLLIIIKSFCLRGII